jgi:hypothetical protein
MHKYEELEKLYYKKKKKQTALIFIAILSIGSVFLLINNLSNSKRKRNIVNIEKNVTDNINNTLASKVVVKTTNKSKKYNQKKDDVKKIKSMTFTVFKFARNKGDNNSTISQLTFIVPDIKSKPKEIKQNDKKQHITNPKIVKNKEDKKIKNEISNFFIKENSVDIKKLINTFKKAPSYDIAMMISKYYFARKDYDDAKLWVLKANNMEPSKYQSWKMFALILLKKHQKNKAKNVLSIYLDDYGSNEEIEKLLRSIDE